MKIAIKHPDIIGIVASMTKTDFIIVVEESGSLMKFIWIGFEYDFKVFFRIPRFRIEIVLGSANELSPFVWVSFVESYVLITLRFQFTLVSNLQF